MITRIYYKINISSWKIPKKTQQKQAKLLANGLEKLDKLIGLANVKEQMHQIFDYIEVHKKRGNMPMLHMVFTGNPRNW